MTMRTARWATWILTLLLPGLCMWQLLSVTFLGVFDPYGKVFFPVELTAGAAAVAIMLLHFFIWSKQVRPTVLAVALVALLVMALSMRWLFVDTGAAARVEERWGGVLLRTTKIEMAPSFREYGSCYRVGRFTFEARYKGGGTYRFYQLWPVAFTHSQWSEGFPLRQATERTGEWQCVPIPPGLVRSR